MAVYDADLGWIATRRSMIYGGRHGKPSLMSDPYPDAEGVIVLEAQSAFRALRSRWEDAHPAHDLNPRSFQLFDGKTAYVHYTGDGWFSYEDNACTDEGTFMSMPLSGIVRHIIEVHGGVRRE